MVAPRLPRPVRARRGRVVRLRPAVYDRRRPASGGNDEGMSLDAKVGIVLLVLVAAALVATYYISSTNWLGY